MEKTLLLFSRAPGWKNRLLSCMTGWSSLDIVLPQQTGQPVFVVGLDAQTGVILKMPLANRVIPATTVGVMTFVDLPAGPVVDAVTSQIGKPFDWRWFMPDAWRRNMKQMDAWFPSELFCWAFLQAGYPVCEDSLARLTLRAFWDLDTHSQTSIKKEIVKKNNRIFHSGEKTV